MVDRIDRKVRLASYARISASYARGSGVCPSKVATMVALSFGAKDRIG